MTQAQLGNTVSIHYTGRLDDGQVFDSSANRDPLTFTLGEQQVIRGFESAVIGMQPGQSKTTKIPAADAYGPRREELVLSISRERLPEHIAPSVGQHLQMKNEDGSILGLTVTDVDDQTVRLDANHPLAGKDLTFEIDLVKIE
ncbi:MAG: FKBP-type peptidyl-prolyl cis-trans isomerase [Gemmatimonadales bacterium]